MHTPSGRQVLELKIPPVALVIIIGFAMWLGRAFAPVFNFQFPFQSIVAWLFAFLGITVSALGFLEFRRAKTTLNPTTPGSSSSLVTHGVYQHTRNPMYLGFLLILLGWATATANLLAFLFLPAFVLYMNEFQITPEERALVGIFGDEFKRYCSHVRRWI
jgi:protein-S-isoprenylcysteine O-methyltransferase Ste14